MPKLTCRAVLNLKDEWMRPDLEEKSKKTLYLLVAWQRKCSVDKEDGL